MKHLSEEELTALYYDEGSGASSVHLHGCGACQARYAELKQDLEGMLTAAIPQRNAEYGEQVWKALRPRLTPYDSARRSGWRGWQHWRATGLATACACLVALAFVGGRAWERHIARTPMVAGKANPQAAQRVVLVVLTDHLDRTERLLVALQHADPSDSIETAQMQAEARDLLVSNRLYRTTAGEAGDLALAGALDKLEGVLAEVANDPNLTSADLERLRKQMNSEGILFEIRVLLAQTPDRMNGAEHGKGASI
jgi:hypothetical protein